MKPYLPIQLLTTLFVITTSTLTPAVSNAQIDLPCFMRDANGNLIDLGKLCGISKQNSSGVITIPIKRRVYNTPVIDVTFNGKRTFEMVVDTGASVVTITPKMAKALALKPEGTATMDTANGTVDVPLGRLGSAAAGGIVANNLLVAVSPSLSIGLLGHNFYQDYDLTIKQDVIELHLR